MVTLTYNLNTLETEAGCKFEAILSYMSSHQQNSRKIKKKKGLPMCNSNGFMGLRVCELYFEDHCSK